MSEEIDFEVDAEDLLEPATQRELGAPSIIVEGLHVTYRIIGSTGKRVKSNEKDSRFKRLLRLGAKRSGAGIAEVKAIRGVSFVAHHGESIGIIGTNGSGKSTLLRALAGVLPPSGGDVYVSGRPSLLGVNAVLMKDLTGERNVMIGGLALGLSQQEIEDKFSSIVDFAGLKDAIYLPMRTYSSGMSARLRFAISTAATPDVLMIDEALATGDAAFRQRSKERIDEIRQQAGTIFLVSHSLATVKSMCTRAIWLDKGVVRMDGPVDDVAKAYRKFVQSPEAKR